MPISLPRRRPGETAPEAKTTARKRKSVVVPLPIACAAPSAWRVTCAIDMHATREDFAVVGNAGAALPEAVAAALAWLPFTRWQARWPTWDDPRKRRLF